MGVSYRHDFVYRFKAHKSLPFLWRKFKGILENTLTDGSRSCLYFDEFAERERIITVQFGIYDVELHPFILLHNCN